MIFLGVIDLLKELKLSPITNKYKKNLNKTIRYSELTSFTYG